MQSNLVLAIYPQLKSPNSSAYLVLMSDQGSNSKETEWAGNIKLVQSHRRNGLSSSNTVALSCPSFVPLSSPSPPSSSPSPPTISPPPSPLLITGRGGKVASCLSCVYVYMCVYVYVCMCISIWVYVYVFTCVCVYVYVCVRSHLQRI